MLKRKLMGILLVAFFFLLAGGSLARAWDYGIPILTTEQIHQLSDSVLKQNYVNVLIELEAAKIFHIKAGFNPRDYQQFKDLIRYRVHLYQELQNRNLDIPKIEP